MAKSTPMKLGTADDVLHDADFQKQLQPELDDVISKIDAAGLRNEYNAFLSSREGNEIVAEKTVAFVEQYNNSIDSNIIDKDISEINNLLNSEHPTIDSYLSNKSTKEYLSEIGVRELKGEYVFQDENGTDHSIDKEYLFISLKEAYEQGLDDVSFHINDNGDVVLLDNNSNEIKIEDFDDKLSQLKQSEDIYKEGLPIKKDELLEKKEELLNSPKEKIDINNLSSKLDSVKEKATEINSIVEKGDKDYSFLSKHNFFKEYAKVERMMLAREYGMKFEGGYVTKTEIFVELGKLYRTNIIDSLFEIALYKILDHIESKEDFERYKETGSVEKSENNNDVTTSNIDNNNDTVEKNSNNTTSNTESRVDNNTVDNDKVTVKIGDFEIDKNTKIDLKEGKINNSDGKSIDIADVKGKIGNIEVSGDTWKNKKDGTDRYGINIVRGQHGEALVKDKIVLEVKGRIEKTGLDDKSAEVLKSGTDKAGNDRYLGIDRDTTVGYVIYDPKADKSEYLDCRFKHIAGEYLGIDNSDLRFSKDQETLQTKDGTDYKLDINIVDKFTDEFIEKISPSDTEIKDKIDSINERITELEEIENKVSLSDDEKSEIDGKISELEDSKNELESFLSSDDNDKTVPERIEMAEHKSEICNSDIEPTKAENDHKDEIEKIKLDKIESKIEIKEKEVETRGIENDKRELSDLRKEYIDNSSLNEEDKATLREAVRDDINKFDNNISGKDISDKEKCAEVVQKIYGRDIEKNPDAEFKSDIFKIAKENVKSEIEAKKEEIEIKKSDIENIKSKYDTEFKITKDYIKDLEDSNRPNTKIDKDKDGKIDSITFIEKDTFKSDKSDKEYQVEKTTTLTFDNEKLTITSELEVDGEKIEIENSEETLIDGYQEFEKDGNLDHAETYDIYGKISKDEHFGENGFPEKVDYYKDGKIDHTEHRNQDNKIENIEYFDKDGNLSSKDVCVYDKNGEIDYTEHRDNDNKLISVEFKHTKEENIESGINDAIEKIKDDPDVKGKGNAVADVLKDHKEDISKVFADKVSTPPDPALVSKVIVETVHNSGVNFDRKESQIKGFLENNPIERTIEKGFDGKNLEGRQLAKDNPLKTACNDITSADNKFKETGIEIHIPNEYEKIWNDLEGSERNKIDAVELIIDGILQNAVNNGDIEPNKKDNIANNISFESGMTNLDSKNNSESNAKIFSDAMSKIDDVISKMDSDTNIPISAEQLTEKLKEYKPEERKEAVTIGEKSNGAQFEKLPEIRDYANNTDLENQQDNLTAAYIEGNFEAADYLTNIMAKNEQSPEGEYHNIALDTNGFIPNINDRIDDSLSAIARYAEKNPDKTEQIANAITKIAKDTGCLCKIVEQADLKLPEDSKVDKDKIIERCFEKIDKMIDDVYGISRDTNNDIETIESDVTNDKFEEQENAVISVVSGVIEAIVPNEDGIKDRIHDVLEKTKVDIKSSISIESKKTDFLNKLKIAIEGFTTELKDHIESKTDIDFDKIEKNIDNEIEEYDKDETDKDLDYKSVEDIFKDDPVD